MGSFPATYNDPNLQACQYSNSPSLWLPESSSEAQETPKSSKKKNNKGKTTDATSTSTNIPGAKQMLSLARQDGK